MDQHDHLSTHDSLVDHAENEMSASTDKEPGTQTSSQEKQDPFGGESDAGVKYKTMSWW